MNEEVFNYEKVKNDLLGFTGGRIFLDKTYSDKGIAIIWFDHVEKRNSITGKMMVDLTSCVQELEEWDEGKAVILCGKGVNFCSGGDLSFVSQNVSANNASNMSIWMMDTLQRLSNLEMISVCIIHGPALGGGAEIPTFCDYILVSEDVKYGFVHGNLGIVTAWGGGTRLIEKVGHRKALDLFLTSKILTSEDCINIGLADGMVSSKRSLEDSLAWLEEHIKHNYKVIRAFKCLVKASKSQCESNASFHVEKELTKRLWGGEEHIKMIKKFTKPRKDTGK